ncbi:MAG TPA: hypothetical protein VET26_02365 [Candidatus Sulfotelmatobacter sp.]|nr:hypothetical protein [Candidatus Sulfotelmatobacter sp.]
MGPPVSSVAWSPDFVAQTLEILPIFLNEARLAWLKPVHAESLRVGLNPSAAPSDVVVDVLKWYPLEALVVHSTSWRLEDRRVILTYAAAVKAPLALPPGSLVERPVGRAELARGGARSAPASIGVDAVLEHALRHLSWLVRDDAAVATALVGWQEALSAFVPEPFRPLE